MPLEFSGRAARLPPDAFARAAGVLCCDPAAVAAVWQVECGGKPFLPDGRPQILFEAHIFSRLTSHQHDAAHPEISCPTWDRSLYRGGAGEYDRLHDAIALDRVAALKSASWGGPQILGANHTACGFGDVESFVRAMIESEARQLDAFLAFIATRRLIGAIQALDWPTFAKGYNGTGYKLNRYDERLAAAYVKAKAGQSATPASLTPRPTLRQGGHGDAVRHLQALLSRPGMLPAGLAPAVDGEFGPRTEAAVTEFQRLRGLESDGVVGPATWAVLEAAR